MIRTLGPVATLDYHDSQSVTLARPLAPLQAWNMIMASPQPLLGAAFRIRDAISARFGVKRIGGFSGQRVSEVSAGDYLDFFLVEETTPERLVLTERDRHLDVMTCVSCAGPVLTITSSVITHNRFGRAYMVPVGLAHRLIVRNMLARLRRSVMTQ
ncbi:DUF2867 domain-containing protein [Altererythrobacter sp. H2]|uniref:DUF2867 domain-containing protein n=1 Tax=Altererythrobacter sp. H2 TaxID=3108391 RepID=UPI000BDD34F1|nr:DUF2867 domain-containing protein [Altererythrobacter sp. H2]OZA94382.1 MAG: hypothetical protein B7X57_01665 [Erythrobacter sp. 34-65-8]WRK96199.1 DUF2867 domain-containing protein [Altererythrobacter sp. H2]